MLKFLYGVMGSSKTAQALIQNHNCHKLTSAYTVLLKPALDTRSDSVSSRIGLSAPCTTFTPDENLTTLPVLFPHYTSMPAVFIIVDEAQFCTAAQVEQLRRLADNPNVNVYCYGLKTNFKTELFEGSKRLLELADSIEEIPHPCACGRTAQFNARFKDGVIQTSGQEIQIGDLEYRPLCHVCYQAEKAKLFLEGDE